MIYLIGGPPRCGKTILARRLSKKLGISWVSADTLESIVKKYTSEIQHDSLFPKDLIRKRTSSSNDTMYSNYTAEEISDAYIAQSKTTWEAISTLIECMIKDDEAIIVEGHQIHPELARRFIKNLGIQNIRAVVLSKNSIEQIVETARKSQAKNDWFIKKTDNPEIHFKIAEMLSMYSDYFSKEANKYDISEVAYAGDFEGQLESAEQKLLEDR